MRLVPATAAVTELSGVRVAILNWREPVHSTAGGAEVYAWNMARGLVEAGAAVDYYTSREPDQPAQSMVEGITIFRQGGFYGVYVKTAVRLWRRRASYDLVIDAENGIPFFAPLYLRSTPVVLLLHHIHQEQFGVHMGRVGSWLGRLLEGTVMPQVYCHSEAIAVSPSTRRSMRERLGWRGSVEIIENGSPPPRPHRRQDPSRELRVCAVSRLVVHKRVDEIIRAVAQLHDEGLPVRLDVIGRGQDEDDLCELVDKLGAQRYITMHGFLDEDSKIEVLQASDVHVCWSDGEGWGQVVLEAAAVGIPTIARDVTGLRDAIVNEQTGWLVGSRDGLALALRKSQDTISDPIRRAELAGRCRERAATHSWPRMRRSVVEYVAARVQPDAESDGVHNGYVSNAPHLPADFARVYAAAEGIGGWLSLDQAYELYQHARDVNARGSRIVEIGSHQGRSTVVLALAADESSVVAIDPFIEGRLFGGRSTRAKLLENLDRAGVRDRIELIEEKSTDLRSSWDRRIDLLYIDGKHDYWTVSDDLRWAKWVPDGGIVLIHDAFSSIGVTLGLLRWALPSRRLRYLGRTGSLARFEVRAPKAADRWRIIHEIPWWIRNVGIKVLLRLRLYPVARFFAHHDTADPY